MMRLRAWSIAILLLGVSVVGANQGSPYEKLLQQAVDSFDKIGMTLKTIVDEDTAEAAKPVLRKSADAFLEARERAAKLEVPEKDEKVRLEKAFKAKLEESLKLITAQAKRVENIPGGKEALAEIAGVYKIDRK